MSGWWVWISSARFSSGASSRGGAGVGDAIDAGVGEARAFED
jgi:hypothetical protein